MNNHTNPNKYKEYRLRRNRFMITLNILKRFSVIDRDNLLMAKCAEFAYLKLGCVELACAELACSELACAELACVELACAELACAEWL